MVNDKDIKLENALVMFGNSLERLKDLPDNSVDSIVTDPPYGLSDNKYVAETITKWIEGERTFTPDGKGFMGKAWDSFVPPPAIWDECLRVLKPGGHLLAFFGSRTQDIGALSIRLAGFEIRDSIAWLYGSGFPKSLNIGKAAGRKDLEYLGTALKPAHEPIVVARKPISESTVANNVLLWGTGGLNIDASRVGSDKITINGQGNDNMFHGKFSGNVENPERTGRFPANLILSHSEDCVDTGETITETYTNHNAPKGTLAGGDPDRGSDISEYRAQTTSTPVYQCVPGCPVAELDKQSGVSKSKQNVGTRAGKETGTYGAFVGQEDIVMGHNDTGGASRFFYVAKASKKDRNEGLDGLEAKQATYASGTGLHKNGDGTPRNKEAVIQNFHPTVKPTALMEYLVRLVTPEGGTVLDPFTGSGSTGKAALLNGFKFIGCELTEDYLPIIEGRLRFAEGNRHKPSTANAGKKRKQKEDTTILPLFEEE